MWRRTFRIAAAPRRSRGRHRHRQIDAHGCVQSRARADFHEHRRADISPPKHILDMYGAEPGKASYENSCLLARRLIERGVRFVEIFHESWDQHGNLTADLKKNCKRTDQASAALVKDLKQRGLLEDTLVIWGGEF